MLLQGKQKNELPIFSLFCSLKSGSPKTRIKLFRHNYFNSNFFLRKDINYAGRELKFHVLNPKKAVTMNLQNFLFVKK